MVQLRNGQLELKRSSQLVRAHALLQLVDAPVGNCGRRGIDMDALVARG
jgi:hypothetical protein